MMWKDEERGCQTYERLCPLTMKQIMPVTAYLSLPLEWVNGGMEVTLQKKDYTRK